jgi:hypothetical protein
MGNTHRRIRPVLGGPSTSAEAPVKPLPLPLPLPPSFSGSFILRGAIGGGRFVGSRSPTAANGRHRLYHRSPLRHHPTP